MRRRRLAPAALLLAAGLLGGPACRRAPEPARPAGATPPSGVPDTPETRQARLRRAEAALGLVPQPGVTVERTPLLLDPDYGAPVAGTLEEGAPVEVLLVEPGFFGVRMGEKGLAFVPVRSVRLLPGAVSGKVSPPRPRREIVPQIISLAPGAGTPPPTGTPAEGGER